MAGFIYAVQPFRDPALKSLIARTDLMLKLNRVTNRFRQVPKQLRFKQGAALVKRLRSQISAGKHKYIEHVIED